MTDRQLREDLLALMRIPGLSGHEQCVAAEIKRRLRQIGVAAAADRLGNLTATFAGEQPAVMLFAHMDQLGFVVRRIAADGLLSLARVGGVPERALAAQAVALHVGADTLLPGVIAHKSHHLTAPDEKYRVVPVQQLVVDTGFGSPEALDRAGVRIGTPVVYQPRATELAGGRIAGTSVDDRAGCAVLLEIARALAKRRGGPTVHLVFSVQEEFNLRGAAAAAAALRPDIAIQIDLMLACDTPDTAAHGQMNLGGGPGISLYSFHGRGTINGVIPHPALVGLVETAAADLNLALQRSAQVGVLTDLSYVQAVGTGIAALDIGFPLRYAHSAQECCDLADLAGLAKLVAGALARIGPDFDLQRNGGRH